GRKSESERVPAAPLNPAAAGPGAPGGGAAGGRGRGGPAAGAEGPPAGGRGRGGPPGAGAQSDVFQRPTDVAWDSTGNIYVADGFGNSRIAKFDRHGKFVKSWGSKGSDPGQFDTAHGLAIDTQGNVYVADTGNKRIQVFDGEGTVKAQITN